MKIQIIKYSSLIVVAVILGYAIVSQLKIEGKVSEIIDPRRSSVIALEVSELIKTNQQLLAEQRDLQEQKNKLASTDNDSEESIAKDVEKLKIVSGATEVVGPGVQIESSEFLQTVQLIDLINALRNIGADAIAIDDQRVVVNTFLGEDIFPKPVIKVIGDSDVLESALTRKGGIIEQIGGNAKVSAQAEMILPAIK
ncbi:MAG: DUF881 domain-containing protein [Patescibacteria group bacterium]